MKKRILSVLLCVAMVGSMLVGCGDSSDESFSSSTSTVEQTGDATDFNWKAYDGTTLNVQFNDHTYSNAIIEKLPEFEELTGIHVEYTITPEFNYFDKLNASLSTRSGTPDIFMSGAYQLWQYIGAAYVEPLEGYINNPSLTDDNYNFDDIYDTVAGALRWDGIPGHSTGEGSQYALPIGYELNALAYNKNALSEAQVEKIKTTDGLLEVCKELDGWNGSGSYGLALRGSRNWGTIHAGYMTQYATWGARDCEINDEGRLTWLTDSQEAIDMTDYWVQLCKTSTPQWSTYTWSEASSDLGSGQAAMLFDATSTAYFQNFEGASYQSGNIAWSGIPVQNEGDDQISNIWVWALAMNADCQNKEAAWYFIQYFTGPEFTQWAATEGSCIDCARESVATSDEYLQYISDEKCLGYSDMFNTLFPNARICFTPEPYFEECMLIWAETLQDLVTSDKYASTEEAMKVLTENLNKKTADVVCE